jgi:hypothetical protein
MSLRFRIGPFTFGKSGTRLSIWSGGTGFSTPTYNRKSSSYGKVKFGMFSYFFNNNSKKKSTEKPRIENTKTNYKNVIKQTHTQAYEPWTKETDEILTRLFHQGKSVKELSEIFGRTQGAIRFRIEKLMLE